MGGEAEYGSAPATDTTTSGDAGAQTQSGRDQLRQQAGGVGYDQGRDLLSAKQQTVGSPGGGTARPTATSLSTVQDFIALVERFESAYPACAADWKLCTTMLRKLTIYNNDNWDRMIADRSDTARPTTPPMLAADFAALAGLTGVILSSPGGALDVTHVLTGADSMNFPDVAWTMQAGSIAMSGNRLEGPASSTWSGDVGSALARFGVKTDGDKPRTDYYNNYASLDDMIGDIDGIAVGNVSVPAGARFSQRLRAYYTTRGSAGADTAQKRYTAFCTAAGFGLTGAGSGRRLDAAAKGRIRTQINAFAWLYCVSLGKSYAARPRPYSNSDLDWFTNHFVQWVERGLAAE